MRKYIISCILLIVSLATQAQGKWTLRQCVDYAVENNIDLRQQMLNVRNSEINLSTTRNSRLPDLNASMGQGFNFGRSISSSNVYESVSSSSSSFDISTSAPLFTGFRIPNEIKVNELNLLAATEGLKKARENLELQVVSYYLEVLFKKEIHRIYIKQVDLSNQQVERTNTLFESGKIPESQLYDIKAQLAKDELNVTMAENNLKTDLLNLAQALNLPSSDNFDIDEPNVDKLMVDNISSMLPPEQIYQMALGIKPHIKEAEYKLGSSQKNLNVAKSYYWPSLSVSGGYGTSYRNVWGESEPSFGSQIRNYASENIRLSLNIPIFNRFQTRNRVRSAKLEIENQSLALDNIKLTLYKEIQQAYLSAVSAQSKFISTEKAYKAAEKSFEYANERYNVGKSPTYELREAQTKLLSSESEQTQAKYDFIFRSKILDFYQGKEIIIE